MSKHEKAFLSLALVHALVYAACLTVAGDTGTGGFIYPHGTSNVGFWISLEKFSDALIPGTTYGKHLPVSFILTVWGCLLTLRRFRRDSTAPSWILFVATVVSGIPLLSLLGLLAAGAALMNA